MFKSSLKSFVFILIFAFGALCVNAQGDASTAGGRTPPKEELPKNIQETLQKQQIQKAKKDHDEMLKNGEEAIKLSEELETSYAKTNVLSGEDRKKLERLEKLLKKIRRELGGDDDDDDEKTAAEIDEEKPSTVVAALKTLQSTASGLLDELKKTSRFSISVVAIQSSNALLKLVRFLKFSR